MFSWTLIDFTVHPEYAGGSNQVLKLFKKLKGHISLGKLAAYLRQLNYIYPYHQAIGFYLQKAGYPQEDLSPFKTHMKFDFYLERCMRFSDYSKEWRIHFPEDM